MRYFLLKMAEVLFVLLVVFIPPLLACVGILVELLLNGRLQHLIERWWLPPEAAQLQPEEEPEPGHTQGTLFGLALESVPANTYTSFLI